MAPPHLNWSQYRTSASGEIEARLMDDNTVRHVCGYSSGGFDYLFFAHDSGACTVKRDQSDGSSIICGWLDESNIINGVCTDDTYLYVAHDQGIGRIATSTLFAQLALTNATQANPCQVTSASHGLSTGDEVHITGVAGMVELNDNTYTVTVVDSDNFTLNGVDSTGYGAYTSGGAASLRKGAAYDTDYGKNNGFFSDSNDHKTWNICSAEVSGDWYLAYAYSEGSVNSEFEPFNVAVNEIGGSMYRSNGNAGGSYGFGAGTEKISLTSEGALFVSRGPLVMYKLDVTLITDHWWFYDGSFGNFDEDFSGSSLNALWDTFFEWNSTSSVTKGANKVSIVTNPSTDWSYTQVFPGFICGDFDLVLTGFDGTAPGGLGSTEQMERKLYLSSSDASGYAEIKLRRYDSSGQDKQDVYSAVHNGTSLVDSDNATDVTPAYSSMKVRIKRTGSSFDLYYDLGLGGGWVQSISGATYTSEPLMIVIAHNLTNMSGDSDTWEISKLENIGIPETIYSSFDQSKPVTAMDAENAGIVGFPPPVAMVGYESGGLARVTLLTSVPTEATVITIGDSTSGKDQEILTSNDVISVAFQADPICAWVGYESDGLDRVNLFNYDVDNANTTNGLIIDNQIGALAAVGSAVYGTGSGATTEGGGFITDDCFTAPEDTEVWARGVMDSTGNINVQVSWEKPDESDWTHSVAYRKINSGQFEYLKATTPWSWSAVVDPLVSPVQFDDDEMALAFSDTTVADGKYTYTITQVDLDGNQSVGTQVVEYVDEPVVSVAIQGGLAVTAVKGIELSLSGDSGSDSGSEPDQVYEIQIKESSQPWSSAIVFHRSGTSPWKLPFYLPAGSGLKTIQARGLDRAGQAGAIDSVNVTYTPVITSNTEYDSADRIMICHEFRSDIATLSATNTESGFDVDNLKDPRLAMVWRGESILNGGDNDRYYTIAAEFTQGEAIDAFFLGNHNLDSNMLSGAQIWLCGHGGSSMPIWNGLSWISNADYCVELTNLIGQPYLCHRPDLSSTSSSYRFWAVVMYLTAYNSVAAAFYHPHIGRLALVRSSDIWTPSSQVNVDFEQEITDQSIIHESDDQTLEAIERDKFSVFNFSFPNMLQADYRTAKSIFGKVGLTKDLLVLPKPSEFATGETDPSIPDWNFGPLYCQVLRNLRLRGAPSDRVSFDLALRQIIGGRSPYGVSGS